MLYLWVAIIGSILNGLVTVGGTVAPKVITPFPIALNDFPYVAVRRYLQSQRTAVLQCCPSSFEAAELRGCLIAAAEDVTLATAVSGSGMSNAPRTPSEVGISSSQSDFGSPNFASHDGSAFAVLMMTSSKLSGSYGVFAEATTAAWATGYRAPLPAASQPKDTNSPSGSFTTDPTSTVRSAANTTASWWSKLDFIAVEIDDAAANGATYGAASANDGHATHLAGGRAPHWQKVALLAYIVDSGYYSKVLYMDADAVVVHTRSFDWLRALVASAPQDGLVVSREAEGPPDLIYRENGAARLNDATYVNTGVLFLRYDHEDPNNEPTLPSKKVPWVKQFLHEWWIKGDEQTSYLFGRTYDQGALGHLLFSHGSPSRSVPPPPQPNSLASLRMSPQQRQAATSAYAAEERTNQAKGAWRAHVKVVEPEVMNNHAPGGSFSRRASSPPSPSSSSSSGGSGSGSHARDWWCAHFEPPVLQLSGQSNDVRSQVLSRVWREGACLSAQETAAETPSSISATASTTSPPEGGTRTEEVSIDGPVKDKAVVRSTEAIPRATCRGLGL